MKTGKLIKPLLVLLIFALIVPALVYGQSGKIRGTVTDAQSGKPLVGADVVIEGMTMGAATDAKGIYIILDVPPGKYTLSVSYMGYKTLKIEGVLVRPGLTTTRDAALTEQVIAGQTVVIVAEKPLVDKNETHEIHTVRAEDIANLPIRGTGAALNILPGVVNVGGIHVRGGRSTEMAYHVDGVNVTMPTNGDNGLSVINNSIEEITYHAGGFGAEYGGRMSGQLFTTLKTGTPKYHFGGELISDDFWATKSATKGYRILGINKMYSYGYDDYVGWASGPVPGVSNIRFYVAGQRYYRHPGATWFEGFSEDSSVTATGNYYTTGEDAGINIKDTLSLGMNFPPGRYPGGGRVGWTVNSNIVWDKKPFRVKLGGTFNVQQDQGGATSPATTSQGLASLLVTPVRAQLNKRGNYSGYLKFTHIIDPSTFYTVNLSYFNNHDEYGDPLMGWSREDWPKWGDPVYNPALLDTGTIRTLYHGPGNFSITYPGTPTYWYGKDETEMIGGKLDFTKQFGTTHEVKFGGEVNYYTLRMYYVGARSYLYRMAQREKVAGTPKYMTDWDFYKGLNTCFIGYDIHGEKKVSKDEMYATNVGGKDVMINAHNAPAHPIYGGAYIQDRIELRDLIINAGVRLDYIDNGVPGYKDLRKLTMGTNQTIADSNFTDNKTFTYVSPRLGFSFPVTDRVIFHAQYGKYIQPTRSDLQGTGAASTGYMRITQFIYGGGYAREIPNPNLKPEKQTSYEFGFKENFGDIASLDLTAFYKDTRDYTTMRVVFPLITDYRAPYFNMNQDFGTIKGLSFTFNLRRIQRIQVMANYTYSVAKGTGSSPDSHFDIAWTESTPVFPVVIGALAFDQRHKGWLDFDLRFRPNDGPTLFGVKPLSRVGLNLSFNFHSGTPYTRVDPAYGSEAVFGIQHPTPLEPYNASTLPWFYQLDGKLEKGFSIGPVNVDAYLWVLNVLNTKSVTAGWRATGRPDDDGWLATNQGKEWAKLYGPDGVRWFRAIMTRCGSYGWQAPRQIRGGLKFEF